MKRFYFSKLIILIAILSGWSMNAFAQTSSYSYTGAVQTFFAGPGITNIAIDCQGAMGGGYSITRGGYGGRVQATLNVTPSTTYYVYVGGVGTTGGTGGFNGGGATSSGNAGAGGGATDFRTCNCAATTTNRLVVAGGGGGGTVNYGVANYDRGGAGGGLTGEEGYTDNVYVTGANHGGLGGTGAGGGAGGTQSSWPTGLIGSLGQGGAGGPTTYGTGGGGGYYGGGGGCWDGGGGGSSFTDPVAVTAFSHTQGYNTVGNGQMTITILCNGAGTIGGTLSVCAGATTPLTAVAASGGTWSSGNTSVATISATGVVSGVVPGTAVISYAIPNPCGGVIPATATVTVNQTPTAIIGTASVCTFATTNLASTPSGVGIWTSSNTAQATVGASSGVVTGVTQSIPTITYTLLSDGCFATVPVTVNSGPAPITGTPIVCVGLTVPLAETSTGGTWSSTVPGVATVNASGVLGGVSGGSTSANTTINYTFSATGCVSSVIATINALPVIQTVIATSATGSNSSYCAGTTSTIHIGLTGSSTTAQYQLILNGTTMVGLPVTGTGSALDFGVTSAVGTYTVIATNIATGCSVTMAGAPAITVTPLPTVETFSAPGGVNYCANGFGVTLQLNSSQSGISYKLFNGGPTPVITSTGTGSLLTFPGFWPAGSYTVVGSDGTANHCSSTAAGGPITVISNPLPSIDTVTAQNGGAYCAGTGGAHIGLNFSNSGITYSLFQGATFIDSVSGSNSGLDFGQQAATGTYTVIGTNQSSRCSSNMAGSATVTVNNAPTLNDVTGGGNFCPGSAGLPVGIDGTDVGAQYQLYNGTATVGFPVTGTGLGFNFGTFTAIGTYQVTAVSAAGCKDTMLMPVSIVANSLPTVYTVGGGGGYCLGGGGVSITLSGSDGSASYQLFNGGIFAGSADGTGGSINFGNFTTAGTYTVVAGNGACTANMFGSATVIINPLPNVYTVTGGGGYCANVAGAHVGLMFSDVGVSYQLYNSGIGVGSPVAGSGSGLDFGLQTSGAYTVIAVNTTGTGCSDNMSGTVNVNMNLLPGVHNVTGGGAFCAGGAGSTISLDASDGGVNYQLFLGAATVGVPVPGDPDGGPINFGLDTLAGTYTVVATSAASCTSNMNGSANITVSPLPHIFTLTGGGNYCADGLGADVMLSGSDTGISYQLVFGGGPLSTTAGTGSAIDFGLQPGSGAYTVVATNATSFCTSNMAGSPIVNIVPLPAAHTVTGGGAYCMGGTGQPVALDGSDAGIHYQLLLGGIPTGSILSGSGTTLNFGLHTAGAYTVLATDPATSCTALMEGGVSVTPEALPNAHSVIGGGAYCLGSVAGVDVAITADEGVTYLLYRGGVLVDSASGGAVADFGLQSAGTYTVVGSDAITHCTQNMTGSAIITASSVNVYTVIGGGSYCQGGTGVHIGQTSSASGVSYQLVNGGVNIGAPVTGTGGAIDFGLDTTVGSYTVMATDPTTTCTGTMAGAAVVAVNSLPNVHSVTGGGTFCAGNASTPIGLNTSDMGVNYQLYNGSTAVGGAISGTGAALTFGSVTAGGSYKVIAANPVTTCVDTMAGSAVEVANPVPTPYPVTAENYGNYCSADSGVHISLSSSNTGVTYELYRGGVSLPTALTLSGTGSALDFGLQTVAGTYTVFAQDAGITAPVCSSTMPGSANVYIIPLPIVYNVIGGGGYCPGSAGVDIGLDGSQAGIYYQLYDGSAPVGGAVFGSGVSLNFGIQPAGTYTIVGNSEVIAMGYVTTCPNPMFGSATASVDTLMLPSVSIQSYPGATAGVGVWHVDSIKVFVTNAGSDPSFQWTINGNVIPGATSATFTNHEFFNGDSVACLVTASGPCGGLSTSKSVVLSLRNVGVTQVTAAGSAIQLVPNPNKGEFTVKGTLGTTADEEVTMEIVNMLGQVIYTSKVMTYGGSINEHIQVANSLANGMYILTLRSGTQNNVIHFVIEQ